MSLHLQPVGWERRPQNQEEKRQIDASGWRDERKKGRRRSKDKSVSKREKQQSAGRLTRDGNSPYTTLHCF